MEISKTIFENLSMAILYDSGTYSLSLSVESGFVEFTVMIPLTDKDVEAIKTDNERATFLQAALHHPFQLKETWLKNREQRHYLDKILHSSKAEVEAFLTEIDHGEANGAISNMVHITCGKDQGILRNGEWFNR